METVFALAAASSALGLILNIEELTLVSGVVALMTGLAILMVQEEE